MQLSTSDAARIFTKLKVELKDSTHHVTGWLVVDGRRVLPLHYSRGKKDMHGRVPHLFRKALHLTPVEFAELRKCTMNRERYVKLLRERGYLT
jgi:hypothetical protein